MSRVEVLFRQLDAVFDLGRSLEDEGYGIVIGGDWNLRLADTDFANTTDEQYLIIFQKKNANRMANCD